MAVTREQLESAAKMRREKIRTKCDYETAKELIDIITSEHLPGLSWLLQIGPHSCGHKVAWAYRAYVALTSKSKFRKANIDRVYRMIHG